LTRGSSDQTEKHFEDKISSGIFNPNLPGTVAATATNNFHHMKISGKKEKKERK
jgi:hypothetical protein